MVTGAAVPRLISHTPHLGTIWVSWKSLDASHERLAQVGMVLPPLPYGVVVINN